MNESNAENNASNTINNCTKFSPNIHKLAFCQFCQASKRVHSDEALDAIEHKLIGSQTFYIKVEGQDENCTLSIINGEKTVSLYDSGILKFEGDNTNDIAEIDLSLFRVSVTFTNAYIFVLHIDTQRYLMESNENISLLWKDFLKKLAEQTASKRNSVILESRLTDIQRPGGSETDVVAPESPLTVSISSPSSTTSSTTTTTTSVDTPVMPRTPSPRYNIRTTSPLVDTKQLQQTNDKLEADIKREKKIASDANQRNEDLQKKISGLDQRVLELERENKSLVAKATLAKKDMDNYDSQLRKATLNLIKDAKSMKISTSSYQFLVNYLCTEDSACTLLTSFLRHQLEYLLHRSPIQVGSDVSLSQYLGGSINMSQDSLVSFVSTFLQTLSRQISPSSPMNSATTSTSKVDLTPNLGPLIQSVLEMNPRPQLLSSNKSFQQTALEIAYLITPRSQGPTTALANGYSEPGALTDQFNELMRSLSTESVGKVLILELGNYMQERYHVTAEAAAVAVSQVTSPATRAPANTLANPLPNDVQHKNLIVDHFAHQWDALQEDLRDKQQEVDDLRVTLGIFSAKILELEADRSKGHNDVRTLSSIVNYYTDVAQNLCTKCQVQVSDQLKSPVSNMVDAIVDDFSSYWRLLNDLAVFLTKKKNGSVDVKEALDMTKKCSVKYESLVKQFQDLCQRTISNPGCSKSVAAPVNEL